MSLRLTCDRCGGGIAEGTEGKLALLLYTSGKDPIDASVGTWHGGEATEQADLCPECTATIHGIIANRFVRKDTNLDVFDVAPFGESHTLTSGGANGTGTSTSAKVPVTETKS